MQEYALNVCWLRYSGHPAAVCINMLCKFNGSGTREVLLLYACIYSDTSLAQTLGKSSLYMQEYALKVCWLRYSGNPAAVFINIFWQSTGSDTRNIALFHARICFKSVLAQILGKSSCCMYAYIVTLDWLRYSGNLTSVVCRNML